MLIAGTRGSELALAQTRYVIGLLKKKHPNFTFDTKVITTSGDELQKRKERSPTRTTFTGKDSFTKEIDQALMRKEIDFAVHSLKDVPIEEARASSERRSRSLELVAFPQREVGNDVLIPRREGDRLESLPENARIGTSSLRRKLQLKAFRPDFEIVEIHGNVPTRIKKLQEGSLDAIVLAEAGLKRLKLLSRKLSYEVLPSDVMLPAIGQGCLAVIARAADHSTKSVLKTIDDPKTRSRVLCERAFSKELGGGCNTPIAALATVSGAKIKLQGLVAGELNKSGTFSSNFLIRDEIQGKAKEGEKLGRSLARKLKRAVR